MSNTFHYNIVFSDCLSYVSCILYFQGYLNNLSVIKSSKSRKSDYFKANSSLGIQ